MSSLQIAICDDQPGRAERWKQRLDGVVPGAEISALRPAVFADVVRALKERRLSAGTVSTEDHASLLDHTDLLIVDSDLTPRRNVTYASGKADDIRRELAAELGGEVAHLARAYTSVGAIVIVNEGHQSAMFDLTLMRWSRKVADAYVSSAMIDSVGLWRGDWERGSFRPWYWPRLDLLPRAIEEVAEEIEVGMPWLEWMGLTDERVSWGVRQLESLEVGDVDQLRKQTFADLLQHPVYGLRPNEETSPELHARIAVCALRRWVDRVLAPSQNVLISLPHLLERCPWLSNDWGDPMFEEDLQDSWSHSSPEVAPDAFNEAASKLTGRAMWNVRLLPEAPGDWRACDLTTVFCEDISAFAEIEGSRDFMSDLDGSYPRRFAAKVSGVDYKPINRLAL